MLDQAAKRNNSCSSVRESKFGFRIYGLKWQKIARLTTGGDGSHSLVAGLVPLQVLNAGSASSSFRCQTGISASDFMNPVPVCERYEVCHHEAHHHTKYSKRTAQTAKQKQRLKVSLQYCMMGTLIHGVEIVVVLSLHIAVIIHDTAFRMQSLRDDRQQVFSTNRGPRRTVKQIRHSLATLEGQRSKHERCGWGKGNTHIILRFKRLESLQLGLRDLGRERITGVQQLRSLAATGLQSPHGRGRVQELLQFLLVNGQFLGRQMIHIAPTRLLAALHRVLVRSSDQSIDQSIVRQFRSATTSRPQIRSCSAHLYSRPWLCLVSAAIERRPTHSNGQGVGPSSHHQPVSGPGDYLLWTGWYLRLVWTLLPLSTCLRIRLKHEWICSRPSSIERRQRQRQRRPSLLSFSSHEAIMRVDYRHISSSQYISSKRVERAFLYCMHFRFS